MADKAISDLTQAVQITNEDLFVLEQSGEAKKLKGSQVMQYAKDSVSAEVQGAKEYADSAKASADAAAKDATRAETAAQGIDDKVAAADASAKAAASSAAAAAASATGVDEKVQAAQTAADNAAKSETAAKNAQTAAANSQKAAESAQTGAQAAKTAAESAQEAAESAKDAAAGSSTAAGQKATQAAQSAEDAASAKSAAETAKTDAQAARDAIVNMIVEAVTVETGKPATVSKSLVDNVYKLVFGLPRGETGATGPQGATGNGISGIALKSGNHAPGTSDVYTITLTDGTTFDFAVYNGANGAGAGDMLASVYDPQGKHQDVFKYVDDAIKDVKVTTDATPTQGSTNPVQSGGVYSALANKLDKTGDGSNVTAAFTAASTRVNIATSEKLSVLFGKIAKWFADLGALAFKDKVAKTDLTTEVQQSIDTAGETIQIKLRGEIPYNTNTGTLRPSDASVNFYKVVDWINGGKQIRVIAYVRISDIPTEPGRLVFLQLNETSATGESLSEANWLVFSANDAWNNRTLEISVNLNNQWTYKWKPYGKVAPATTSLIKGNGSGGLVAATRGSDYIASGNIVKQTLAASESTPTENYAINWVYG